MSELDPYQILFNKTGFRSKFHIYEITKAELDGSAYFVRKQLLSHASTQLMHHVNKSEKHVEIRVARPAVADIVDTVSSLSIPATRTGHPGKDGTWYSLQIGMRPCSTTIRWWCDMEPELKPVYELRDRLTKTVNNIIRSADA